MTGEELYKLSKEIGFTTVLCGAGVTPAVRLPMSNDFLDEDIDILELSVRSWNALMRPGLTTVRALVNRLQEPRQLTDIRNLGRKSVAEIKMKLTEHAYSRLTEWESASSGTTSSRTQTTAHWKKKMPDKERIPDAKIAAAIRKEYPLHTKGVHSMAMHPEKYGVTLTPKGKRIRNQMLGVEPKEKKKQYRVSSSLPESLAVKVQQKLDTQQVKKQDVLRELLEKWVEE